MEEKTKNKYKALVDTKLSQVKFPFFILKGDSLIFEEDVTFNNIKELLDYIETGMTEEEKEEAREDHIAGDQP